MSTAGLNLLDMEWGFAFRKIILIIGKKICHCVMHLRQGISWGYVYIYIYIYISCCIPITTTQILLPAFNFNGQSLKLPDEYGPTISDHTKQHCRNKRSMITPEAWSPVIINISCCMYTKNTEIITITLAEVGVNSCVNHNTSGCFLRIDTSLHPSQAPYYLVPHCILHSCSCR